MINWDRSILDKPSSTQINITLKMLNYMQCVLLVNYYFLHNSWQIWAKEREKEWRYLHAKILKHSLQPSTIEKPLTKYARPHGSNLSMMLLIMNLVRNCYHPLVVADTFFLWNNIKKNIPLYWFYFRILYPYSFDLLRGCRLGIFSPEALGSDMRSYLGIP